MSTYTFYEMLYRGFFFQLSLYNQNDEHVLEILGLAHQYGFQDLQVSVLILIAKMNPPK